MKSVGSYEAKTHLSRLLDEVAGGEEITITKHGVAVPPPEARSMSIGEVIKEIRELRQRVVLGDEMTLRQLIEEGRR